jgi:hypothetical protein
MTLHKSTDGNDYRCDKCGAEITTGLMAVFCPKGKECEFWVPEVEEFKKEFNDAA